MHSLHTHWPCVLQQPHQKHITIRQLKHTTTNKLHYNINHCYLWFAVSKCKHNVEQNHPRGEIFPPKKKKKVSRLGPFFAIFQLQLRNLYGFFLTIQSCWLIKKIKKCHYHFLASCVFIPLISCVFWALPKLVSGCFKGYDHLLEVLGAVRQANERIRFANSWFCTSHDRQEGV